MILIAGIKDIIKYLFLQSRQSSLEDEKFLLDAEMDRQSGSIQDQQRDFQVLVKDNEYAKEREAVLMGDR